MALGFLRSVGLWPNWFYTATAEHAETASCPTVKLSHKKGFIYEGGLTPPVLTGHPLHTLV